MSLENDFISKLLETNDFDTVVDSQINLKHFSGGYKRAFKYIQEFKQKYAKVPSAKEFSRKFPDIEIFTEMPESMKYYCESVKEKQKHNVLVSAIEEASEKINELETDNAYKIIKKAITTIESEIATTKAVLLNENTASRWEAYQKRKDSGGITGLPTGIKPFDLITGGIQLTDLIMIAGSTGLGKSWCLVLIAVLMAKMGYNVLFITREMSPDMIAKRADAMWNGFSYTKFNRGKLSAEEESAFKSYLEFMEQNQFKIIFENAGGGVTSIAATIDRYSPDICLVDGGYLMTDDEDDSDWKGLVNVCRGLKNIALSKKIPIVTTMQMTVGEKVAINKLSFSKHMADEVDGLFGMEQIDMQKEMREMTIKPLKVRDAEFSGKFVLKWDLDKMDFTPQWQEGVFEVPAEEEKPPIQSIEEPKKRKVLRRKNEGE